MGLDDYEETVQRSVWENKNGSKVTTVSGLLETGEYKVKRTIKDDGTIELQYIPIEDD